MMGDTNEVMVTALLKRHNETMATKLRTIQELVDDVPGALHDSDEMKERVTRLEVEFEHVRKDLDEIKGDAKAIRLALAHIPTKGNLLTYILLSAGLALAVVGIFVAVLTYLNSLGGVGT